MNIQTFIVDFKLVRLSKEEVDTLIKRITKLDEEYSEFRDFKKNPVGLGIRSQSGPNPVESGLNPVLPDSKNFTGFQKIN